MKLIAKILVAVLLNFATLFAIRYFVSGFELTTDLKDVALIALAFTALNYFVKPVLRLFLGPIIILTLGLGLILVNALILMFLDFSFDTLTIQTTVALLKATTIFGVVNFIYHFATRK